MAGYKGSNSARGLKLYFVYIKYIIRRFRAKFTDKDLRMASFALISVEKEYKIDISEGKVTVGRGPFLQASSSSSCILVKYWQSISDNGAKML